MSEYASGWHASSDISNASITVILAYKNYVHIILYEHFQILLGLGACTRVTTVVL